MNLNGRAHPQPGRCDKTRETLSVIHDPAGEVEGPRATCGLLRGRIVSMRRTQPPGLHGPFESMVMKHRDLPGD
jgi:hypothetical protein